MIHAHPTPTGASHEVGPEEMFFSTTDAKGIIKEANTVFVRLSCHDRDRLVGAPHNIIRHPSMPGGAFLLMWQTLEAGKPFCAYVDNLAADGSRYTVFATITPLGDDYLSVRVRPQRTELLDAARGLYEAVRPQELAARDGGASAHDAVVHGLGQLAELLVGAGIPSYDEFIWAALPAEVRGRSASTGGYPARPDATGLLADLLRSAGRLHDGLAAWVDELDGLAELADALVAGGRRLRESVDASEASAAEFSGVVSAQGGFSPILGSITLWADMITEIDTLLDGLADRLGELRTSAVQTRFRIALSALQSETVGQFACELIDAVPGSEDARPAIHLLVQALREGVTDAAGAMDANAPWRRRSPTRCRRCPSSSACPPRCSAASRPWRPGATTRPSRACCRGSVRSSRAARPTPTPWGCSPNSAGACGRWRPRPCSPSSTPSTGSPRPPDGTISTRVERVPARG